MWSNDDERTALATTLRCLDQEVEEVLNRLYNEPLGFAVALSRAGRDSTVYQVLANIHRNLSLTVKSLSGEQESE